MLSYSPESNYKSKVKERKSKRISAYDFGFSFIGKCMSKLISEINVVSVYIMSLSYAIVLADLFSVFRL